MKIAQTASTFGDFKVARKHQSCHKLMNATTSLIGREGEQIEEAKRSCLDIVGIYFWISIVPTKLTSWATGYETLLLWC